MFALNLSAHVRKYRLFLVHKKVLPVYDYSDHRFGLFDLNVNFKK